MGKSREQAPSKELSSIQPATRSSQQILLDLIVASPTNPRKSHDQNGIIELAESMAPPVGLIQPITIRAIGDGRYEIISGHRRVLAARHLGWTSIDAIVRDVTDEQALEIQILENLQREDVNAMDEALAFQSLLQKQSLDWLCSKIHKSKKYVQDRLKLNELAEEAREWVSKAVLPLTHAIMISKLPIDEQKKCVAFCVNEDYFTEKENVFVCTKTVNELKEHIESDLMIDFAKVCFDLKDAELVPEAGPCSKCPKRTGNQNLLFSEITDLDKCTDPGCFNSKVEAHVKRSLRQAKEEFGNENTASGQFERYGASGVKVRGVSMPYHDTKKKETDICIVITKEPDSHRKDRLGKKVFIDGTNLKRAITNKENNAANYNTSRNNVSYEERNKLHFLNEKMPRLKQIPFFLKCSAVNIKKVARKCLMSRMDDMDFNDVGGLAYALGIFAEGMTPEEAYKIIDGTKMADQYKIYEKIIDKIGFDNIGNLLVLLQAVDMIESTSKAKSVEAILKSDYVFLTWADLVAVLKPVIPAVKKEKAVTSKEQPPKSVSALVKKKSPVKKAAKKNGK